MATIKILTDAGVCLCPCFSYPVGLYMFFASEPLATHILCICELWVFLYDHTHVHASLSIH